MKPAVTTRFACGDCQAVFDLSLAPESEWSEQFDRNDYDDPVDIEPTVCPFCGAGELKALHDRPLRTRRKKLGRPVRLPAQTKKT